MKNVYVLNKALLFACVSMYFGTGWSLVLFTFPIAPRLTPDNYYNQFVPQVTAATHFFTYMTMVMMVCCVVFMIETWRSRDKWYPIVVLLLVVAATLLTIYFIIAYNERMAAGITDPIELNTVLDKWMFLNIIRVSLWTLQWLTLMIYFSVVRKRQRA
jgi:MFS superfamily sulfate permease-like transporter